MDAGKVVFKYVFKLSRVVFNISGDAFHLLVSENACAFETYDVQLPQTEGWDMFRKEMNANGH